MTRYEILLGIAPPPEPPPPPDYVMGVDLSHRGETTCCICHREDDDCIHIDSIYRIPDHPPDRPLAELRHQWGLMAPDVMMDRDMKNGKWKEARERAVFGRYQYSDDIKINEPYFAEYLDDVSQGYREFDFKRLDHQHQDRVDALALAVHMLQPRTQYTLADNFWGQTVGGIP